MDNRNQVSLRIEGMHCDGCVRRVTSALKGVSGVEVSKVDVGSAAVSYDPSITAPESIVAAIEKIGFTAKVG